MNVHRSPRLAPKRQRTARQGLLGVCLGLAALAPGAGAAPPQPPPPVPQPQSQTPVAKFDEQVSVGYVLVPTLVRARGGYVNDLKKQDFRLFVDGKQVPIESFERGNDAPVSLVFLQDLSGSMGIGGKLEASREAARFFFDQVKQGDQVALASFSGDLVQVDVPFTSDLQPLREAVAAWEASGTTALHDAVAWLPEITLDQTSLKRAAILITDGVDNRSTLTPEQARELVRKAELPVYVLGLDAGSPYEVGPDGKKVWRLSDTLNLLAALTGGKYYPVTGPYEMKEACASIAEDLRHQYVIGFTTGGGVAGNHTLKIEVAGKQRAVSFRRGYRGSAPMPAAPAGR